MQKTHCSQFELSTQQRTELEEIIRKRNSTQGLVLRARIILAAAQGQSLLGSAKDLNCNRETVTLWRKHWVERSDDLSVLQRLKDEPRPGHPPKFTEEEVCKIMALACEKPEDHGYMLSHWSQNALVRTAVKEQTVTSISQRQVGRFLKSGRDSSAQSKRLGRHAKR